MIQALHRLIRSLILPNNAGVGDPQTVIGPDIPTELQNYYNPNDPVLKTNGLVTANILFRGATLLGVPQYYYIGQLDDGSGFTRIPIVVFGYVVNTTVKEICRLDSSGSLIITGGFKAIPYGSVPPFVAGPSLITHDLARGGNIFIASQSDFAGIGSGFSLVLDTGTTGFMAGGRAFRATINGQAFASLSTNTIEFYVNMASNGGGESTVWQAGAPSPSPAAAPMATNMSTVFTNVNDRTSVLWRVYARAVGGGTVNWRGSNVYPRSFELIDIGAASDYPNAIAL